MKNTLKNHYSEKYFFLFGDDLHCILIASQNARNHQIPSTTKSANYNFLKPVLKEF